MFNKFSQFRTSEQPILVLSNAQDRKFSIFSVVMRAPVSIFENIVGRVQKWLNLEVWRDKSFNRNVQAIGIFSK